MIIDRNAQRDGKLISIKVHPGLGYDQFHSGGGRSGGSSLSEG